MKLSEIRNILQEIRVVPVKTLGQNFLHDQNLARWIVQKAQLSPTDFVVEIGPGLGALTEPALATGARVLAIEKDGRLVDFLRQRFAGKRLEIIHGDALEFDVRRAFSSRTHQVVRQSSLQHCDRDPASVPCGADADNAGSVDVTERGRVAAFGCAPFQRLRNSQPRLAITIPRRFFALGSRIRLSSAARGRFRLHSPDPPRSRRVARL